MMIYTPYMNIGPIFLQLLILVPIYSIASRGVVLAYQTLWLKQKAMLPKPLHRHCKRRFILFYFKKYIFSHIFIFLPLPSAAFLLVCIVCFSCVCVLLLPHVWNLVRLQHCCFYHSRKKDIYWREM